MFENWGGDQPIGTNSINHEGFGAEQVIYNTKLLIDSGYLEGEVLTGESGRPVHAIILNLTMKGHDFLDEAKNDTVWNKTKAEVVSKGASVSLAILQELLKGAMKVQLGL